MEAARVGGTLSVVMNAADEVAVELFLAGRIGFLDIARVVGKTMEAHDPRPSPSLDEIYAVDAEARARREHMLCRAGDLIALVGITDSDARGLDYRSSPNRPYRCHAELDSAKQSGQREREQPGSE